MNVVGISGSLRAGSFNTGILHAINSNSDFDLVVADISQIPLYRRELDGKEKPAAAVGLTRQIRAADGVILATPEYNYSFSGVIKNAIDWVSRFDDQPFAAKPVGIVSAAAGRLGGARAQYPLRQVMVYLDARVMNLPEVFVGGAREKFDEEGGLTDPESLAAVAAFAKAFSRWITSVK